MNRKFRFENGRFYYYGNHSPQMTFLGLLAAKWLILTVAVLAAAVLIENIEVSGFFAALFAAAAIGFLNMFFKPILLILTLPINIMSLGLFTIVINALLLRMASGMIGDSFNVVGFWSTIFGAIVISVVNWFLTMVVADTTKSRYMRRPRGPGGSRTRPGSGPDAKPGPKSEETIDLNKKGDRWE